MVQSGLEPIQQSAIVLKDCFDHEVVQSTGNIASDMRMSKTGYLMDDPDGIIIVQLLVYAEQTGGHDSHQTAVSVIPLIAASAFQRILLPFILENAIHRAAANIKGLPEWRKRSIVQSFDKIVHNIMEINGV